VANRQHGYTASEREIAISQYHEFPITSDPAGRNKHHLPWVYEQTLAWESQSVSCGTSLSAVENWPRGSTPGYHLRTSLTIAHTYGRDGLSENLGSLSWPTTVSSSLCAFRTTSGCDTITKEKVSNVHTVWSNECNLKLITGSQHLRYLHPLEKRINSMIYGGKEIHIDHKPIYAAPVAARATISRSALPWHSSKVSNAIEGAWIPLAFIPSYERRKILWPKTQVLTIASFTCWNGVTRDSVAIFRHSLTLVLNPARGNHSGMYLIMP
jgi:hypothetical protein